MFPSGQWSFNPQAYQNVPFDKVDWASLAQQWIQLKDNVPTLDEPTPPPAPHISSPPPAPQISASKNSRSEPPASDIEGGEAPMDMDTKDDEYVAPSSHWNNWPNQWGWGWSENAGTVPPAANASSKKSSVKKGKWSGNSISTGGKSSSGTRAKENRSRPAQKPPVVIEQTPDIDAIKKKKLPAWIREGLNKMEREKQKKIEQDRLMQERLMRKQESFEEELPEESPVEAHNRTLVPDEPFLNTATIPEVDRSYESSPVAPRPPLFNSPPRGIEENTSLIRKTKDEIMEESMLKIRRILTEILLEATENQVEQIAKEEQKRAKLAARAAQRRKALALRGNLGLNIYGSGSEDSDSSGSEQTQVDEKSDSDEELMLLIVRKKQDFSQTEDEIEIEIQKQEARERLIALQEEEEEEEKEEDDYNDHDDDHAPDGADKPNDNEDNKNSYDFTKNESEHMNQPENICYDDFNIETFSGQNANNASKYPEYNLPNHLPHDPTSSQVNGDHKNGKVKSKRPRSSSSSSSSSSSGSSSSESSKSTRSSRSRASHRKRAKHKERPDERRKQSSESSRRRSRSRSTARRDSRSIDSRSRSSRSYRRESYGHRSSPHRRRSRSRRRSPSRDRGRYGESSRRYESHSKQRHRRSNSNESRRFRYERR